MAGAERVRMVQPPDSPFRSCGAGRCVVYQWICIGALVRTVAGVTVDWPKLLGARGRGVYPGVVAGEVSGHARSV